MKLSAGDTIGPHYKVVSTIGSGSYGVVYRVLDRRFNVERALKLVKLPALMPDEEVDAFRERFFREARTLASLHVPIPHPNIVQVHDIGEVHGVPWFTMQLFPGVSLTEWLDQKPRPSADRALHVMKQLAAGLAHSHSRGVKHRDIKLGNTLVSESEGDHAVLIDFGIAKADDHEGLTQTGEMSGTKTYMAPEYLIAGGRGEAQHTEQTDLWALGCVFYALVVGRRAFDEEPNLDQRIILGRYTPVLEAQPHLDPVFASVVTDLLQVDVAKRMKTAKELQVRLDAVTRTVDPTKPIVERAARPRPRERESSPVQNFKLVRAESTEVAPKLVSVGRSLQSEDDPFAASSPAANLSKSLSAVALQPVDDDEDLFGTAMPPSKSTRRPSREEAPTPPITRDANTFLHAIDNDVEIQAPTQGVVTARAATPVALAVDEESALPAPDFAPKVKVENNKSKQAARRTLVLIAGVVTSAVGLGAAYNSITFVEPSQPTFVAPAAQEAKEEDTRETLAEIERRKVEQERANNARAATLGALRSEAMAPPPAPPPAEPSPAEPVRASGRTLAASVPGPAPAPAPASVGRYGVRTTGNNAAITAVTPTTAPATASAAVKGVRIPVRLKAAATSAPGPIIAIVVTETQVGNLRIPSGTEIHGTSSGTSGPRLNITFNNAIIGSRNVALRGSALASDNRGGLPGTRSLGNGSDAAARAAQAVAAGGTAALADAVGLDPLADGIRAGADATTRKADRLNTEEDLLTVPAGVRFSVYVEAVSE